MRVSESESESDAVTQRFDEMSSESHSQWSEWEMGNEGKVSAIIIAVEEHKNGRGHAIGVPGFRAQPRRRLTLDAV
jgi:hypothetical protein